MATEKQQSATRRNFLAIIGSSAVGGCTAPTFPESDNPSSSGSESWPMRGYDTANTGFHPTITIPEPSIDKVWRSYLDGNVITEPTLLEGMIYTGAGNNVYAINARDGSKQWVTTVDSISRLLVPAPTSGAVFVTGKGESQGNGRLLALDPADGTPDWSRQLGVTTSPVVDKDAIYVGGKDTNGPFLATFDRADGAIRWRRSLPCESASRSGDRPAIGPDRIYATTTCGNKLQIHAINKHGEAEWTYTRNGSTKASPVVGENRVYVTNRSGYVHAITADTGKEEWTRQAGIQVNSSPAFAEGRVFVGDLSGTVYAIDSETGSLLWTEGTKIANINPTVANDTVLIGGSPMYALNVATGSIQWEYKIITHSYTFYSPIAVDGAIYANVCTKPEPEHLYDNYIYRIQ